MDGTFFERVWFLFKEYYPMFFDGMKYTILIALTSTIIGLLLAILLVPLKIQTITNRDNYIMKKLKRLGKLIVNVYVEVLRGTPMMVQSVIIYYGLVGIGLDLTIRLFGKTLLPGIIVYGIAIVSINTSAYIIEVLRGSINSIEKGQMEASRSLGLTRLQAMRHVIIPQALKNSIPAIGNEFVINIKDTAVLSIIAVTELFFVTRKVNAIYYRQIEGFVIAAILYLIMTFLTTRLLYMISNLLGQRKRSYPTSQTY